MSISGFTFARNADTLYYPIEASIRSALPICDEFVVVIGKSDPGDRTREIVASIGDPKIRIIDTDWEQARTDGEHIFANQTNAALDHCRGTWCLYIQTDEVLHERYLDILERRCRELEEEKRVEAMLFTFRHFWGDYDHYHISHAWYPREIRIIRNGIGVRSYRDAQSFRKDGRKLLAADSGAEMFHYGWVRPPDLMQRKRKAFTAAYHGNGDAEARFASAPQRFDYGSLEKIPRFRGTHPAVMDGWIARMDWREQLRYQGKSRTSFKHDRLKYRLLTWIEQRLLGGTQLFGFKNYTEFKLRNTLS